MLPPILFSLFLVKYHISGDGDFMSRVQLCLLQTTGRESQEDLENHLRIDSSQQNSAKHTELFLCADIVLDAGLLEISKP